MRAGLILLVFSFFLLLVCGNDGWLRPGYDHVDSSWFFMGGKAWMSGLTPYLDFADSKGPLLWLVYGIGYLLSPVNFYGVFLMEVLFYWGTFVFIYLTALILLRDRNRALLGAMLSALFFFLPLIHSEIRAEDFNQLFSAMMLYAAVRIIAERRALAVVGLLMGISLGGSLMMKYSFTVIAIVPAMVVILYCFCSRGRRAGLTALGMTVVGFGVMVAPFVVYFAANGALDDFIREYFVNSFYTVQNVNEERRMFDAVQWARNIKRMLLSGEQLDIVIKTVCLFGALMPLRLYRSWWMRAAVWSWLAAALVMTLSVWFEYYLNYLGIFGAVGVITLMSLLPSVSRPGAMIGGACAIMLAVLLLQNIGDSEFTLNEEARQREREMEKVETLLSHYKERHGGDVTIAFVGALDRGEHVAAGALPGIKYWARQNGSTPAMDRENREEVFVKRPDIVVTLSTDTLYRQRLERAGYHKALDYHPFFRPGVVPTTQTIYQKKAAR